MRMMRRRGARRAAPVEPRIDPTAMNVERMPQEPAAFPNTVVAMRALVIWKFIPRALTTKISAQMMRMSVRLWTYTTDSRSCPVARGTRVRG